MVKALDRKLLRDLAAMPGQACTIALVVAAGVGAFIAQLSTIDSLLATRTAYYQQALFGHVFVELKRAPAAVLARVAELPDVAGVGATVNFDVRLDLPGVQEPLVGRVVGVDDPGAPQLNRLTLRAGRWPERAEAGAVLVSEGFALARGLQPGSAIAALLNGRRTELHVVGVVLSPEYVFASRGGVLPDDRNFGVLWLDRNRLSSVFGMDGAFNHLCLRLAPGASEAASVEALDRLLVPYGGFGAYGRDSHLSNRMLSQEINEQRAMSKLFPVIFLGVAAFLLHVVMSRQVASQRLEIAALKAIGYGNAAIALHFVKLALLIVAVGIAVGMVLGIWLGFEMTGMYTAYFHFPALNFRVAPWIPMAAAAVSLVAGVGGAVVPVLAVARLPPAAALRPPVPAVLRRSILDYADLARRIAPPLRMVVRTLERNLLRTVITCVGVSCAVAVVVAGTFWRDAVDFLLDVQFSQAERGDVTLSFADPVASEVLREVRHLPGILEAEPMRAVPVRLVAGAHHYLGSVVGVPQGARLRRLLDDRQRDVALPPTGLLLGDRLASRLRVKVGDSIVLHVLEGKRIERRIPVEGILNDLFGLTAYMDLAALQLMLGVEGRVSAVVLNSAGPPSPALMAALRSVPRVATVTDKRTAVLTFERTSARNLLVLTSIISGFAVALAVGVVYNSARVALAERAWELASLRVLGFTRGEVSGILLSELAIQVLLAIPLGLWLGYLLSLALVQLMESETFALPLVIRARTYAVAAGLVALAALGSALMVRRRIDRLDLVAVLKTRE